MNQIFSTKDMGESEQFERVDSLLKNYTQTGKIAGALAYAEQHGQCVYNQCFGMRNLENHQSMTFDTIFRIYSMTKPITAVAVMMLYEAGHFELNTPISQFIPEFQNVQVMHDPEDRHSARVALDREITIGHLLSHMAGLAYGMDEVDALGILYQKHLRTFVNDHSTPTLKQFIEAIAQLPLAYQPGKGWRYSFANDVLGYLVEIVSEVPFAEFLKQRIFDPLGMIDTDFYVQQDKLDRFAACYSKDAEGNLVMSQTPPLLDFADPNTICFGGAGLLSTATDYLHFVHMLQNGGSWNEIRFLEEKTVNWMAKNRLEPGQRLPDNAAMGYGLGFGVVVDPQKSDNLCSLGTYGWGGMASTSFWIDPQKDVIGLLMTQFLPSKENPIADAFKRAINQSL